MLLYPNVTIKKTEINALNCIYSRLSLFITIQSYLTVFLIFNFCVLTLNIYTTINVIIPDQ